jgi:hypothetical protein
MLESIEPSCGLQAAGKTRPIVTPEYDIVCIQTESCLEPSGNGLRLVIKDNSDAEPNTQLAPFLGEAFMLLEKLSNGSHDSIEARSKALQVGKGHINSRIRLTFLSPDLIRKVLDGDMPRSLRPTKLLEASKDLPIKWAEQDRFLEALAC